MNILQINATDDPIGGASRVALDLHHEFLKSEVGVDMFVGKKTTSNINISPIKKTFLSKAISYIFSNDLDFFKTDFIIKSDQFKKADIINCHNLHGWYFNLSTLEKMCKNKPVVWTLHDMWSMTPHCAHSKTEISADGFFTCKSLKDYPSLLWPNQKYLKWKKRNVYEKSDFSIIVPSEWLKKKVEQSVLKDKKIFVVHNGVDTTTYRQYDKEISRKELDLPSDKKIVLFTANMGLNNEFKGGKFFQQIASRYGQNSNYRFVCLGGDIDEKKDNIIFRKKISDKTLMAKYLSSSDILLFPSLSENLPLTVIEAQACGLPVVGFDVGGVKEIIKHKETGYVAKYLDLDDLIVGIKHIEQLSLAEKNIMSQSAISNTTENFSISRMKSNYLQAYNETIKNFNDNR